MGFNPNLIQTIDVKMCPADIDALRNDLENISKTNRKYECQRSCNMVTDKSTGERFIAHSAIVDGTNKYMQKSDYSMHGIATFEGFTDGHLPSDSNLYSYEIAYYKCNF
ncbi:hypothetical protein [Sphingobacterium athyrii]|uniref:Uncharacterized protein n=1 Tax=Sphingobacterium athyrii TaxID=2152717 RepID=A0A363NWB2_9SPHI|nr:hypothetical protein [Sphingobacterium athyrii]PUV25095.1 hypothetical protein DCO56_09135 [Sphingobacterium athyrii]